MKTPCGHYFHSECLAKWMDVRLECPYCRGALPPSEEQRIWMMNILYCKITSEFASFLTYSQSTFLPIANCHKLPTLPLSLTRKYLTTAPERFLGFCSELFFLFLYSFSPILCTLAFCSKPQIDFYVSTVLIWFLINIYNSKCWPTLFLYDLVWS